MYPGVLGPWVLQINRMLIAGSLPRLLGHEKLVYKPLFENNQHINDQREARFFESPEMLKETRHFLCLRILYPF